MADYTLIEVPAGAERERFLPLLLLADESPQQVRSYMHSGELYAFVERDGIAVGIVLTVPAEQNSVELKAVAVDQTQQNQGIGRRMLAAVIEELRRRGVRRAIVGTANAGIGQIAYYQKAGFRLLRIERDFFSPARGYPAVASSARLIGSLQVQNRATLGGNICNAAPSADAVPALICLGARARIAGPNGDRDLLLEDLFAGPGRTYLAPGELLTAILLAPLKPRTAASYLRFTPRREMDIAIAGAGALIRLDPDGLIVEARVALASVGPVPLRAPSAENVLVGERPSASLHEEAGRRAARDAKPISDTRGSADYRRTLVAVLTARALAQCCRQLDLVDAMQ